MLVLENTLVKFSQSQISFGNIFNNAHIIYLLFFSGLPDNVNIVELDRLLTCTSKCNLHPMSMLTALLNNLDDVTELNNRLKFSAYDRDLAYFIVNNREEQISERPLM